MRTGWAESAPVDTPWSRQREASDRLTPELLKLATREFGEDILLAWADFNQVNIPEPLDNYPGEEAIFSPYMVFEWNPDSSIRRRTGKPTLGAVASLYVEKHAKRLTDLELLILEQAASQPTTFYEIVRVDPGHTVVLRDALIGGDTEVEEHSGSRTMRPGDLVYAQIWKLPEVATIGRLAPRPIPPDRKVAKLRRKIAKKNRVLSAEDLLRYSEEIRYVYLVIRDAMLTPKTLANTDGEPFVFHTLTFRIGSAQLAFDALAPLALGFSKVELNRNAQWNADGSLQSVEFDWIGKGNKMHKDWENTVLGHLSISDHTLIVEVNSANRAKNIREQIEKRLGLHATHLSTTSETPEDALAKRKEDGKGSPKIPDQEPMDPEMQEQFAAQMQERVEAWIHEKIPLLHGRTPLQAVADPDGREMVEGLLLGWERQLEIQGPLGGFFHPDFDALRRLLNLPVAIGTVIH